MKGSSSRIKKQDGGINGGIYKDETRKIVYLSIVLCGVLCSYYRTISNFSQIYLNQLEALLLLFLARILFAVINWTHPKSRHS